MEYCTGRHHRYSQCQLGALCQAGLTYFVQGKKKKSCYSVISLGFIVKSINPPLDIRSYHGLGLSVLHNNALQCLTSILNQKSKTMLKKKKPLESLSKSRNRLSNDSLFHKKQS